MGSWGSGLFENDEAIDALGGLADSVELTGSPGQGLGGVVLLAWLFPAALRVRRERVQRAVRRARAGWAAAADHGARELLARAEADPGILVGACTRPSAEAWVLGAGEAGTLHEALWRACPDRSGASVLAQRCRTQLDAMAASRDTLGGATLRCMAHAGVLWQLRRLGESGPEDLRAAMWGAALEAADVVTTTQRAFWDPYMDNATWVLRRVGFDPARGARTWLGLGDDVCAWRVLIAPTFGPPASIEATPAGLEVRAGSEGGWSAGALLLSEAERTRWDRRVQEALHERSPRRAVNDGVMVQVEVPGRERSDWCPSAHTRLGALVRDVLAEVGQGLGSPHGAVVDGLARVVGALDR